MTGDPTAAAAAAAPMTPAQPAGKALLRSWLNKNMRVVLSDGRVLVGIFLCTDKDANIILGSCTETLSEADEAAAADPRILGLAMVPGRHITSIKVDEDIVGSSGSTNSGAASSAATATAANGASEDSEATKTERNACLVVQAPVCHRDLILKVV
jgi:small nuclear ribonucleoprotein (snRNP)-like protein